MNNYIKGQGGKVAIKFTEDIVDLIPTPPEGYPEILTKDGTVTASNQYSATYSTDKVTDGSTSSYWQTRLELPQWLQIQLPTPRAVTKFRWYIGSSYRPEMFEFYGSLNGVDFTLLLNGSSDNTTGWKEFSIINTTAYSYYRWNITSKYSSYVNIYEIELYYKEYQNEAAFTVTGQEYKYVNGPLIDKTYAVDAIERCTRTTIFKDDFTGGINENVIASEVLAIADPTLHVGTRIIAIPLDKTPTPRIPQFPVNTRIKWDEWLWPTHTVTVETLVSQDLPDPENLPEEGWEEQQNNELVTNIPEGNLTGYFLWLKYTLHTTDDVSPTISPVEFEEETDPMDSIWLIFNPLSRFPTVEGDLTVVYDASLGNLQGEGGVVESFTKVFTPTDLEPEPNPNGEEIITVVPYIYVNYQAVEYIDTPPPIEYFTVAPAIVTVNLIKVDIIDP